MLNNTQNQHQIYKNSDFFEPPEIFTPNKWTPKRVFLKKTPEFMDSEFRVKHCMKKTSSFDLNCITCSSDLEKVK